MKCLFSCPEIARRQNDRITLLGGGIKSSFSSKRRVRISQITRPAHIETQPRTISFLGKSAVLPISTIEFWIGAGVAAGADSRKERDTAGTPLYHKIDGNKAFEQRDRQLHSSERTALI